MFVSAALAACVLLPQAPAPELLSHSDLSRAMHALEASSDGLCRVLPIAHSRAEREVLALEFKSAEAPADQPAILVVANLEGPQVFSSALALWEAEELVRRHAAGDESVHALLASTTLYIVPRANPDAAEARFADPLLEQRGNGHGRDNDRDGLLGEDGPADLDGDGFVTQLRVADPDGTWIEDPCDARAMVEADPIKGERGRWKIFPEGLDSDEDEAVGEDPAADTELNRNFSHGWEEHTGPAGLFPMDEPEARGLAEFVLAHDDIALVLGYGDLDNLVKAPKTAKEGAPAVKRIPAPGVIEPDAKLLAELGERYAELVETRFEGSGRDAGSFQAWAYHHRGLLTLSIRPWDIPLDAEHPEPEAEAEQAEERAAPAEAEASRTPEVPPPESATPTEEPATPTEEPATPTEESATPTGEKSKPKQGAKQEPKPSDDAKRLVWMEVHEQLERFRPWTPFEHPQLGPVEIGGFAPYARLEPPTEASSELADAQLSFLLTLGADLARVALTECTATELGGGLVEVEASLEITGRLPLQTASARRTRLVRPARVTLLIPEGAEIVAGKRNEFVSELGVGDRARFRWLVLTPSGSEIGIVVDTDNAGSARIEAEVK